MCTCISHDTVLLCEYSMCALRTLMNEWMMNFNEFNDKSINSINVYFSLIYFFSICVLIFPYKYRSFNVHYTLSILTIAAL